MGIFATDNINTKRFMKKFFLLTILVALVACQKETVQPETVQETASPITFELTANYGNATKAVKTGWEAGDVVFVFFQGVEAPKHLQLRYDGSSWTAVQMNGDTEGDIGLSNGQEGLMRAVYFPFGNDTVITTDYSGSFFFSSANQPAYYSYWLTGTLHYVVNNNKVSGAFNMCIPEGMVQFWIEDPDAAAKLATRDEYYLYCPAIKPVEINEIIPDSMDIYEFDYSAGKGILPNAYEGGFLFAGRLAEGYTTEFGSSYYFRKTKKEYRGTMHVTEMEDLYVKASAPIQSHDAIKLPSWESSRWQPVLEDDDFVELSSTQASLGKWKIKNFGDRYPGYDYPKEYNFATAVSLGETVPDKQEWEALIGGLSWAPVCVGEDLIPGLAGVDKDGKFIFLQDGVYWTSTPYSGAEDAEAYAVVVNHSVSAPYIKDIDKSANALVRALVGPTDPSLTLFNPERTL